MQERHLLDCYQYTLDRLKELSDSYDEQLIKTEDFARWNLPDEFAESWSNMEYFIEILYSNQKIDKKVRYILEEICTRFNKYSYGESEYSVEIWNHNAMATGLFWDELRKLAKQALENMKTT